MKAITKGAQHFATEAEARAWLSEKVLGSTFVMARIIPPRYGQPWCVLWVGNNGEEPDGFDA